MKEYVILDLTKKEAMFISKLLEGYMYEGQMAIQKIPDSETYGIFCDFSQSIFKKKFIEGVCEGILKVIRLQGNVEMLYLKHISTNEVEGQSTGLYKLC